MNVGFTEKPLVLDAPVSGGVPAAQAGTLTFMVLFSFISYVIFIFYLIFEICIYTVHESVGWWFRRGIHSCKAIVSCNGKKDDILWWSRQWISMFKNNNNS